MPRLRPGIAAALAAAIALAALVGVSLHDEELDAQARALFERPARAFAPDSGWALLAGFDAPPGRDPVAHARASSPRWARTPKASASAQGDELKVRAAGELLCSPESMDCVRGFAAKPASIDDMAADNALLLARYDELLRSRGLADVVHGLDANDVSFPGGLVLAAQRMRLSQAGAAAARGRTDAALAWLEADAAFYRRWLDEAGTLLSKMLATRGFTRSLIAAGQVARAAPSLSPPQREALDRIAAPLSPRERGIAAPMRAEAVLFAEMLERMIAAPRAAGEAAGLPSLLADVGGRTLRRNATLNYAAPLYGAWTRLDGLATSALGPEIERIQAQERAHLAPDWRWAYNYAGRSIVAEGAYDVSRYVHRLRDADALAAVIRCAVALRAGGTPKDAAPGFIAAQAACRDPFVERPFEWDAGRGMISFKASNAGDAQRLGGAAGRVGFEPYPR